MLEQPFHFPLSRIALSHHHNNDNIPLSEHLPCARPGLERDANADEIVSEFSVQGEERVRRPNVTQALRHGQRVMGE